MAWLISIAFYSLVAAILYQAYKRSRGPETSEPTTATVVIPWFHITVDSVGIQLRASPPGRDAWKASIPWGGLSRVVFETADFDDSDTIYLFLHDRENSYVVPVDAINGHKLLNALVDRGILDARRMTEAASAPPGTMVDSGPLAKSTPQTLGE
jgi:hypothetical protein